jgi:iron complex outermembrane receptor protein
MQTHILSSGVLHPGRRSKLAMLAGAALPCLFTAAHAQVVPTDVGRVSTDTPQEAPQSSPVTYAPPPPGSAADVAPSRSPLEAAEPTSIVGSTFIANSTIPAQNYDELIKFTPSLMNVQPSGPVSQQNYGESIRGFQYNQFNTTFDGLVLPGGPSNFAPQSATYFTSHDLGSVVVDRGPGTASTIGCATFGGTVGLLSKDPLDTFTVNPYSTFGSFNQELFGTEIDSGAIAQLGGGRGFIDYSRLTTDTYLTGQSTDRTNVFGKWQQPLGASTTLTFVGMLNYSYGHTAYGTSIAQLQKYGPDYGLSYNTKDQDFYGYNSDVYNTDFEYLRLASALGDGWNLEVTPYTDSYFRKGTQGKDDNGTTPNLGEPGSTKEYINGVRVFPVDDPQGNSKHNDFRDWGGTVRVTRDTPWGQLRFGVWYDYIANGVYRSSIDYILNNAVYTTKANAPLLSQNYHDNLRTIMPYVEFAWKPLPNLTITPGVRFSNIQRNLDAVVLSGAPLGHSNHTWDAFQPSVEARYLITRQWSAYAQFAIGFLAPPLNTLETAKPVGVTPQTTQNYQVGTAYQIDRAALAADAYYIPFKNYIASNVIAGNTIYQNLGGAVYKGIETEGTFKLRGPLSLYANATLNDANFTDGAHVYQAPQHTGAAGFLYNKPSQILDGDALYGSIVLKNVGKQYGLNVNETSGPIAEFPIKSYTNTDLAIGYTVPLEHKRTFRIGLNLYNIFNNHSLIGYAGATAENVPLYWTDPGFSGFVNISASL